MGLRCSCIRDSNNEATNELNYDRMEELSKFSLYHYFIIYQGIIFIQNDKIMFILKRIQARVKGLLYRKNIKTKARIKHTFVEEDNPTCVTSRSNIIILDEDIKRLNLKYEPLNDNVIVELKQSVENNSKAIYYGERRIDNNSRHGRGIQIWADGSRYEGYWKNDQANLKGKLYHFDGDIYEGEWFNDKADGFGLYLHKDGAKYEGYWKDDKQHGKGCENWPDGTHYEGHYENGKKEGYGCFHWPDKSSYRGNFLDNNIHGNGFYNWGDERKYTGDWKYNKMDGYGVFIWPDGRKYTGDYKKDKKEGFGFFEWSDGRKYKGSWLNGKQHGEGEFFTLKEKIWKKGIWDDGKRVRWID